MIQTLFIVLTLLLSLFVFVLLFFLYKTRRAFQEYRRWAEDEIDRVSQTDAITGALKPGTFLMILANECRRAIREFSPLTLMLLDIKHLDGSELNAETFHQVTDLIRSRLSRPGDQLGCAGDQQLYILMPSTNENVTVFAEACHEYLVKSFEPGTFQFTLAACTYEPSAELSSETATKAVNQLLAKALIDMPGGVSYQAQSYHDFNPMYS